LKKNVEKGRKLVGAGSMIESIRKGTLIAAKVISLGMVVLICSYMFFNSIFSTCVMWYDREYTFFIKDFPILIMLGIGGLLVVCVVFRKVLVKILRQYTRCMIIGTSVWICLISLFALNTDIEIVYDQARIYEGLQAFLNGDTAMWEQGGYFYLYPFQNGLLLLFAPIKLVFKELTYGVVQGVNILFIWLIALGMYKIALRYFKETVAVCTYMSVLYFFPLWGYVKYFYGNVIGLGLIVWAVYWISEYIETNRISSVMKVLVASLLAIICKSNFSIFVVAIVLVLWLEAISQKQWKFLVAGLLLLGATVFGMLGPSWIVHLLTGCVTNQGVPSIQWVMMGVRESSVAPGWYNGDTVEWFAENGYSVEVSKQKAWSEIRNAMQVFDRDKEYMIRFFARKFASIWNNPAFEGDALVRKGNLHGTLSYWMKDILYNGGFFNTILMLFLDIMQSVYLFGVILYFICFRKEYEVKRAIPLIALIGGVIFHTFWEAKCQYTITYYVCLLMYAFAGYERCIKNIVEWRSRNTRNKVQIIYKSNKLRAIYVLLLVIIVLRVSDNVLAMSTIKLQGQEADYIWACKECADWKSDDFNKGMP